MAQILKFIRHDNSFDPDTLTALGAAYDLAIASLRDQGQPEEIREIIASRIITAARNGERDTQTLSQIGLRGISRAG